MDLEGQITREHREVNFETGEVVVAWTQAGVNYDRRLFISRKECLFALLFPGKLTGQPEAELHRQCDHGHRCDT